MSAPWWMDAITNPFGLAGGEANLQGHSGIDFGTGNNDPLSFPIGGKVIKADYRPWGGEVAVQMSNGIVEFFLHVNDILVKVGDTVKAGQTVATAGGGVGDKLLSDGKVVTATYQGMFGDYSTGYHTHFGLYDSAKTDFETALYKSAGRIDPTSFINTLRSKGSGAAAGLLGLSTTNFTGQSSSGNQSGNPLDGLQNVNDFFKSINDYISGTDWVDVSIRSGLFGIGAILLVLALYLVFNGSDKSGGTS